jgi:outer membrane murein-binding lipoprotein Lpp
MNNHIKIFAVLLVPAILAGCSSARQGNQGQMNL